MEPTMEELSNTLHKAIMKSIKDMLEGSKVQVLLRADLEQIGCWGIVIWNDADIEEELKQLDIPVTPQLVPMCGIM
jgi:hypothetical protein